MRDLFYFFSGWTFLINSIYAVPCTADQIGQSLSRLEADVDSSFKQQILEDVFLCFEKGFIPNFLDPNQIAWFELYRVYRFSNFSKYFPVSIYQDSQPFLLSENSTKKSFGSIKVIIPDFVVQSDLIPGLGGYLNELVSTVDGIKQNLLDPKANSGWWKKILI